MEVELDLYTLVDRIERIADALRLKSSSNPMLDDVEDLANALQDICDEINEEL